MGKKRFLATLLFGTMLLGLLSGCGKQEKSVEKNKETTSSTSTNKEVSAESFTRNEKGYPDLKGETITIWFPMTTANAKATGDLGEYKPIKEIEKKFNVNLEFIHPPVGQERDNFAIMMADKELPDMIFGRGIDEYYPGGVNMAYEDGILYDYTAEINENNTPNFYNLIQKDEFLKKAVTDDSGRIIRLGAKIVGSKEADLAFSGPMIRKDYLEKTGLPVPETIEEWTKVLEALKKNGVEYPLALSKGLNDSNIFCSAFGVDNKEYIIKPDGKVTYGPYEENYKEYLTLLNDWYSKGYINPDFSTQTADDIMSLFSSGRVGIAVPHLYTYGVTYYVTTEMEDETKGLLPIQIPVLKKGDKIGRMRKSNRQLGDYKYITSDAKNPKACVALLDALYLEDIDLLLSKGIEGVAYKMEDGVPVVIPMAEDSDKETLLSAAPQQWHTKEDTDLNYILTKKYNKGAQDEALILWKENTTEGQLSNFVLYNTVESEVISQYSADVETYVEEMTLKFITGTEPLSNFEKYRENLKSLHIEELIATRQSASDRFESR